jgi:hypothetical protein
MEAIRLKTTLMGGASRAVLLYANLKGKVKCRIIN